MVKAPVDMVFFAGYGSVEFFINLPVSGIDAAISDHFVMLFWDMFYKTLYKFHNRDSFFHVFVILMTVVMESNEVTVIVVNTGSGDYRSSEIASDILHDGFWVTFTGFGIDVKAGFVFPVAAGLNLFKGWSDPGFHFVKEGGAESITKVCIVKMADIPPESVVTVAAFGNEAVDVGIPFQVPAKGVEDHDKTGSEIHGFVLFKKHAGNNAANSMKKAVKEGAVIQKKIAELLINGKNTMPVGNIDQFKGHGGSAFHSIFIATGGAETAVAAERDEFQLSTVGTAVHGTAESGGAAVNHLLHVFNDRGTWM